jgi:hypothetical protein
VCLSTDAKLVLVAKSHASDVAPDELSVFPTERHRGFRFTQQELIELSARYSQIYLALIEGLASRTSARFGLGHDAARMLAREAVPTVVHVILDRLLRVTGTLATLNESIFVATGSTTLPPARTEQLRRDAAHSAEFNQWLVGRLASAWPLETTNRSVRTPELPIVRHQNNNFTGRSLAMRLWRRSLNLAADLAGRFDDRARGSIPVLSLAYPTPWLQDRGLYWFGGFRDMTGQVSFDDIAPDPELRRSLLGAALDESWPTFENFIEWARRRWPIPSNVASLIRELILDLFPTHLLEGIPVHLPKVAAALRPFKGRGLIIADVATVEVAYFLAAAREEGVEPIGCQQGGHYGYEDDFVSGVEMEYPFFDRFITWGWTRFPDATAKAGLVPVPLPSPWLAVRRRQWNRQLGSLSQRVGGSKPFDLLLMPNKIYPYPPAPSGAAVSRIDHIQPFAALLRSLISGAAKRSLRVFCKSYDAVTIQLLGGTFADLEQLYPEAFHRPREVHKGLTRELLAKCHLVLWDQPGTGFLECATSGIPTIVLWPRLYNQEVPWAQEVFRELETTNVVCRDVDRLLDEVVRFKDAPLEWMQEPRRKMAIERFLAEYGRSESNWPAMWRGFQASIRDRKVSQRSQ